MNRPLTCALVCVVAFLGLGCGDDDTTEPPDTGSIQVTLAMAGTDLDSDGCLVTIDAGATRTLQAGESATFSNLETGSHVVQLTDIAGNCEVQGESVRTVQVAGETTTDVTFAVVCSPLPTGSIQITTVTTGQDVDPGQYAVLVGGEPAGAVGTNAVITIADVPVGDRSVELTDLALNCAVSGENPRTVTVTDGGTVATTFEIECLVHIGNRIVFVSWRTGSPQLYVMTDEGEQVQQLTDAPLQALAPDVSPDGTQILFSNFRALGFEEVFDIYVMNADGSGLVQLTAGDWMDHHPVWSPDGTQIAYQSDQDGPPTSVWIMNADGSGAQKLTAFPSYSPAWSPDGTRIAFVAGGDDDIGDIHIMNVDGSGLINLTPDAVEDNAPAWSPDGQSIAFTSRERDGNTFTDIYVVSASGGQITNLTSNPDSHDYNPDWSPDGYRIVFSSSRSGAPDIYVMDDQGGPITRLTVDFEAGFPDWGPLN